MLGVIFDEQVDAGRMDPAKRPGAETAGWAAVHGPAVLLLEGLLRHLPEDEQALGAERTLDLIVR